MENMTSGQTRFLAGIKAQHKTEFEQYTVLSEKFLSLKAKISASIPQDLQTDIDKARACQQALRDVEFCQIATEQGQALDEKMKNISVEVAGAKLTCYTTAKGGYDLKTILEAVPPEQHAAVLTAVLEASSVVISKKAIEAVCDSLDLKKSESAQLMNDSYRSSIPFVMMRESGSKTELPFKFE